MEGSSKLGELPESPALRTAAAVALETLRSAINDDGILRACPPGSVQRWEALLARIFCCSRFVARILTAQPQYLAELLDNNALTEPFNTQRLLTLSEGLLQADELGFMAELRRLRQREMIRIAMRDLLGWATLSETLAALSSLADFCVQQAQQKAFAVLTAKHGMPIGEAGVEQHLLVLAMGKLGGQELNYSSDIDLMFAYIDDGETQPQQAAQRAISHQQFFTQQAQYIIRYLHEPGVEGFVFRVDTRLRPFGDSGALVTSYGFMENYYQRQGRDWERYAMVKARVICGQVEQAEQLMSLLQPFMYRRYLDYGAFESLRDMKALIASEVKSKGLQGDIKLGAGGIREIEFIGQAFQLIRGGPEPAFRLQQIRPVLKLLAEKQILPAAVIAQLLSAYTFLRNTENRLQMFDDQQTHHLPEDEVGQQRLAYAMAYSDWQQFSQVLQQHRDAVNDCFQQIFSEPESSGRQIVDVIEYFAQAPSDEDIAELLGGLGIAQCSIAIIKPLRDFMQSHSIKRMGQSSRRRMQHLLPLLLAALAEQKALVLVLPRVLKVIQAVAQRSVYLSLLAEYPVALQQLVRLCAVSPWIADYLAQHPVLLDSLLNKEELYQPLGQDDLRLQLAQRMQALSADDVELQLNTLRHFKQEQTLRIAACDMVSALPLMRVSDQLSWLAEAVLIQVRQMAFAELSTRFGRPCCVYEGQRYEPELAIVAYGKLGGLELGYGSDLDVVFVHNSQGEQQQTDGERSLSNDQFFIRLAQKIMHILNMHTIGGVLYELDLRLRPDGRAGVLVSSLESFEHYQQSRAWVWEHQALVRARKVAGSEWVNQAFLAIRNRILQRDRDLVELRQSVCEMRERMRSELSKSQQGQFDLKYDRGGMADIEFMVQYGVLAWSAQHKQLTEYTDNIRLLESFAQCGLMSDKDSRCLIDAYQCLRSLGHRLALQEQPLVLTGTDLADYQESQAAVAQIWQQVMHD